MDLKNPVFQSLVRSNLILGCERELIFTVGILCISFAFGSSSIKVVLVLGLVFPAAVFFLRRMAEVDPMMSKVYSRHVKQKSHYVARSTPWRIQHD